MNPWFKTSGGTGRSSSGILNTPLPVIREGVGTTTSSYRSEEDSSVDENPQTYSEFSDGHIEQHERRFTEINRVVTPQTQVGNQGYYAFAKSSETSLPPSSLQGPNFFGTTRQPSGPSLGRQMVQPRTSSRALFPSDSSSSRAQRWMTTGREPSVGSVRGTSKSRSSSKGSLVKRINNHTSSQRMIVQAEDHSPLATIRQETGRGAVRGTGRATSIPVTAMSKKEVPKQCVVSIIQYVTSEVGIAVYNKVNGQIHLCRIIEKLTYFRTLSTLHSFTPLMIIYPSSQHTPLIRKLQEQFRDIPFKAVKRASFDDTKGYQIYASNNTHKDQDRDSKFIAYGALHALILELKQHHQVSLAPSSLSIKWHELEGLLVIELQTIKDLEILEPKKGSSSCLANSFECCTHGGTRMLRSNMLQPLSDSRKITERHKTVGAFLKDTGLYQMFVQELPRFKNLEQITARLTQRPKEENIKSLKVYLTAICSLSRLCTHLEKFSKRCESYHSQAPSLLIRLFSLLKDIRLTKLRQMIVSNFQEQPLSECESNDGLKTGNLIFLLKADRMGNDFVDMMRVTHSHTIEDLLVSFQQIRQNSGHSQLKLMRNENRGYYIRANKNIDLTQIAERIEQDIVQINERGRMVTFSTPVIASFNNRIRENQEKLILLSEPLLCKILTEIQTSLEVLFEINHQLSTIDMLLSFARWVKNHPMLTFVNPLLSQGSQAIKVEGLRTPWTGQSRSKMSDGIDWEWTAQKNTFVIEKQANAFKEVNLLFSLGYVTVLTQIGCFLPAKNVETEIFQILVSKFRARDDIESGMSHFHMECSAFKAILCNTQNHSRSLVLLDELQKGTQYEDELALSMMLLSMLARRQCKTYALLSDHYLIKTIEHLSSRPETLFPDRRVEEREWKSPVQVKWTDKEAGLVKELQEANFSEKFMRGYGEPTMKQTQGQM